uniref:Retrotransposon protein, putative, Ty3-gypsy subclass n=1 Tax=Oryza sativa subsp. japonica TaxID=39947 RepID=Q10L13_ORYSJ|nr:retrotransposon protein, putative, Ty3-gypsy subclass [Oryza sativa Japonica Group]
MDLGMSTSTSASLKKLQEDGALPGRGAMEREPGGTEPEPVLGRIVAIEDYILCGFLPPPSEFLLLVLNFYGLSLLHLNPNSIAFLSIFSHLCEAYIGVEPFLDLFRFYYELRWMESTRVSGCLSDATVERRVGQLMISGLTTASDVPMPLYDKEAIEREAAINALPLTDVIGLLADHQATASLKESVARETPNVAIAAAATTSGSRVPKTGRTFTSVLGRRRRASSPPRCHLNSRLIYPGRGRVFATSAAEEAGDARRECPQTYSWAICQCPHLGELQAEMKRILEAGARGVSREIEEAKTAAASSANKHADKLERDLAEVREDLQKMRELVAGNEWQRRGLEDRMSELENNLSEIRGSLRVTYTGLHQLAGQCGVTTTIPANPDEFSLTSSLAELATAMEAIPSKHAARVVEEASNGIYTGLSRPSVCPTGAPQTRSSADLGPGGCQRRSDVDVEDVQQRGQPKLPVVAPAITLQTPMSQDDMGQDSPVETGVAMTSLSWELRVPRGDPEESAAGYISWLNGACTQLEGVGKRIDEALKQECRRSSRYAGGHVLACIRDHRPQLHLEFLHIRSFSEDSGGDRTPGEVDGAACGGSFPVDGLALAFLCVRVPPQFLTLGSRLSCTLSLAPSLVVGEWFPEDKALGPLTYLC